MATRRIADPRYSTARWQKTRKLVLQRDMWQCYAPGCNQQAVVADHIEVVWSGMEDWQFYSLANLRASCWSHNTVEGRKQAEHALHTGRRVVHNGVHNEGGFLARRRDQDAPVRPLSLQNTVYAAKPHAGRRISQGKQPKRANIAGSQREAAGSLTGDYTVQVHKVSA